MSNSEKKPGGPSLYPRVSSDHPIYSSGYIMLRPVYKRREEPSEADAEPPEKDDQQTPSEG